MISTKKQSYIFYSLLCALTLFAVLAHLNIAFRVLLYAIVIVAPVLFDDTKTISVYFYGICFKGCFGSTSSFWVALNVSILILEIKKLCIAFKTKQDLEEIKKIFIVWAGLLIAFLIYSLLYNKFHVYRMPLIDFVQCTIAFLLVRKSIDIKSVLIHLWSGIVLSALLGACFNLLDISNLYIAGNITDRYGAFFAKINTLAVYCTLCSACFISLILTKKLSFKRYFYFPIISTLIGLTTYSKAFILVNILLYMAWFGLSFIQSNNKKRFALYSIVLLVALALVGVCSQNYIKTIIHRFTDTQYSSAIDNITTGRAEIWEQYLSRWLTSPLTFLFGNGCTASKINAIQSEHSTYVALLYQFGVVGIACLVATAIWSIRKYAKVGKSLASYIPLGVMLVYGLCEALSGGLYTCLVWFMAFYFVTFIDKPSNLPQDVKAELSEKTPENKE